MRDSSNSHPHTRVSPRSCHPSHDSWKTAAVDASACNHQCLRRWCARRSGRPPPPSSVTLPQTGLPPAEFLAQCVSRPTANKDAADDVMADGGRTRGRRLARTTPVGSATGRRRGSVTPMSSFPVNCSAARRDTGYSACPVDSHGLMCEVTRLLKTYVS